MKKPSSFILQKSNTPKTSAELTALYYPPVYLHFRITILQWRTKGVFMYTIVESDIYTKMASAILTQDEQEELATFIASQPEAGDVIPHSSGCRKLRWQRQGMGKRGGSRVIYFNKLSSGKICLLLIYAKAKSENIPAHLLKQLKEELEQWL